MKNKKNEISKIQTNSIRAIFISVFFIIIFIALYLAFLAPSVSFSPEDETVMSFNNARSLLSALGKDGIDWYCGKITTFNDAKGNLYGQKELEELKRLLGNNEKLRDEFCKS